MNLTPHGDVIDATARAMTIEDAPGDLRARVLAKLPSRRTPWGLRLVLPVGSAAALVLAWMLIGPTSSAPRLPEVARHDVAKADIRPQLSEPASAVVPVTKPGRRVSTPMSPEDTAWHARAVAPLAAFAPIELPAIQPAPLSIAPITVDPIVTDAIPLKALDAPGSGRQ